MADDAILIAGAREHNLKNITVRIPRNRLTVITGLSGSGKSSLAFDTLYAEGQRRYVESMSAYARQFLDQLRKPDVDAIEGLSPAIAIEQRTAASNPRSIVATATEIHDYLRLLYAHVGERHCPGCGRPVPRQSAQEIVEALLRLPSATRLTLLAPRVRGELGAHAEALEAARKQGFVRVRLDGRILDVEALPALAPDGAHRLEIVVDRLVLGDGVRARLADSVELTLQQGGGELLALAHPPGADAPHELAYAETHSCQACNRRYGGLTSRHFSFNSPDGACRGCAGLGTQLVMDESLIVPDPGLSLEQGAVQAWRKGGRRLIIYYKQQLRALAAHAGVGLDVPYRDLPAGFRQMLMHGTGTTAIAGGHWRGAAYRRTRKPFEGVVPNLVRRLAETDSSFIREQLRAYMRRQPCPDCGGARLRPEVLACTVGGVSMRALAAMTVSEAAAVVAALPLDGQARRIAGDVVKEILRRLRFLDDVGLGYLTLDRECGTLSGGELQRIRLATQIGSGLVGVIYVLDEPTVGLHPRDTERLIGLLLALRDRGNTLVVVEHDAAMIRAADHIIDLGPGAGRLGGAVLAEGDLPTVLAAAGSDTARHLRAAARRGPAPARRAPGADALVIEGAAENNLKEIDVRIPLGLLVCVTGVSGSGKSTLVDDILRRALFRRLSGAQETPGRHRCIRGLECIDKAILIDQDPVGRTPRSNPATYTGAFGEIRELFARTPAARVRGYGPARFSFNMKGGRCEACRGDGLLRLEMHFLPDVYVPCQTCGGARYNHETLQVHYQGRSIAAVLDMTIDEALAVFANVPAITRKLRTLADVGLGYLQLGQPATTLSGGEAQRMKLAAELSRPETRRTLYLLDEPTTGLHFSDVERLTGILLRLREGGNSVVVIEHNLDVIRAADYIIDLGPEGGAAGGRLVACGTPEEVAACADSHTGRHLRAVLMTEP